MKQALEQCLKQSNRKSEFENVDLQALKPNFSFNISENTKNAIASFKKELKDYILVLNEFLKNKSLEERARAKKPKLASALRSKYD
jgi:hypothetical protein